MVEKEKVSQGSEFVAFIITLVALPLLFVGTCVPVGLMLMGSGSWATTVGFILYGLVFLGFVIRKAVLTKNYGIKGGIIIVLVTVAVLFIKANWIK